uniref:Prolyl 4-hydroxylase alpha subunit Fe(2+) 2OG dioxygenase domain-containing protein n=1 Tax=viral metagenome TaxID=1070528 RepID=A0A6C0HCY5_9ZZZZ
MDENNIDSDIQLKKSTETSFVDTSGNLSNINSKPMPTDYTISNIQGYNVTEYKKYNIYIIENILENDFCDELVKTINLLPTTKMYYKQYNNVECHIFNIQQYFDITNETSYCFTTNPEEYSSIMDKIKSKNYSSMYTNKLNGVSTDTIRSQTDKLNEKMEILQQIFNKMNDKIKLHHTGFAYRKIYGRTRLHVDGISEVFDSNIHFLKNNHLNDYRMIRNASIIFTLNDDYQGGQFNFPLQEVSVRLNKGSVIVFPPYWTHPHEVSGLENNTFRYTVNTWSAQHV